MPSSPPRDSTSPIGASVRPGAFPPTRWSLITRAAGTHDADAFRALSELLQAYWQPLYVFARRSGLTSADAADAVQGFCETLVRRETLRAADPARGRLRSFLLGAFRNHLRSAHRDRGRERRGGGVRFLPLDGDLAGLDRALDESASPDTAFERRWILTLLDRALRRLRVEYEERKRGAVFAKLEPLLAWGGGENSHAQLATELGLTEAAVHQAVKRMRVRYRVLLESEIAQTVEDDGSIADERDYLIRLLSQ